MKCLGPSETAYALAKFIKGTPDINLIGAANRIDEGYGEGWARLRQKVRDQRTSLRLLYKAHKLLVTQHKELARSYSVVLQANRELLKRAARAAPMAAEVAQPPVAT